ncbi:MAG TPA: hypothetical protein VF686_06765 [Brevundimonas sp.]|jgi:hypothetical protein
MIILGLTLLAFGAQALPGTPCPEVGYPQDYWGSIRNNITSGDFTLQTQEGITDCRFTSVGIGRCFVYGPARFLVKSKGRNTYFAIPDRLGADIQISEGSFTCRARPFVGTD